MPEGREFIGACVARTDVYAFGGWNDVRRRGTLLRYSTMGDANVRVFLLGGCMYAAGGYEEQSVEKYDPDTDNWSDVSSMLGNGRRLFCAQSVTTRAEIAEENLFDMLIAKAEAEVGRQG